MLSHTSVLISIISCNPLGLLEPFGGICFGHTLSKVFNMLLHMTKCLLVYYLHL